MGRVRRYSIQTGKKGHKSGLFDVLLEHHYEKGFHLEMVEISLLDSNQRTIDA